MSERDVWKLTADQKRKLIIKAVRNGYVAAIQDFKDFLRHYEETRKMYEVSKFEHMQHGILLGIFVVCTMRNKVAYFAWRQDCWHYDHRSCHPSTAAKPVESTSCVSGGGG